jgi:3',5'-cyclic AMP phosphodiesterase CpdA
VAVLLHLSDLHLRSNPAADTIGDPKAAAIPASQQQTNARRIRSTLEAVARSIRDGALAIDCVVISGDVVDKNDPQAYALLPGLLSPLVPAHVPAERVVVVPGNHDVAKGSPPSSEQLWKNFLQLREYGYVTPPLEGIDIDDDGNPLHGDSHVSTLVAGDESFVVVALNSANHSQVQLPIEDSLQPHQDELVELRAANAAVEALWSAWDERGSIDVAWVDEGQQRAAGDALTHVSAAHPGALRIAVMHHQLLPTGPIAEIKSFETMVNLGELLDWISDMRVDVVLHGHKHSERVYPFEHTAFHRDDLAQGYRTLVISAPTGQTGYGAAGTIARLIEVEQPQPRTSGVVVADVPSIQAAGRFVWPASPRRYPLDPAIENGHVVGEDVDEVHAKLLALRGRYGDRELPLICRIERGVTASRIPAGYPDVPEGIADRQQWFDSTVAWWQARRGANRAARFNHGERLAAYGTESATSGGFDQIAHAAKALEQKPASSRAIAVLVDPDVDLSSSDTEFPAFVLVQFAINDGKLDVTGYYRKQEMPHWWPVNAAELRHLQAEVIQRISSDRRPEPGSITTITAQPVLGGSVPRVMIPDLDSRVDAPNGMLSLVLPLFRATDECGPAAARAWRLAMEDWSPKGSAPADGDPVPRVGLEALVNTIEDVQKLYGPDPVTELVTQLRLLMFECDKYLDTGDSSATAARDQWVRETTNLQAKVLLEIDRILGRPTAQRI